MMLLRRFVVVLMGLLGISCSEITYDKVTDFGINTTSDKVWAHRVNVLKTNYNKLDEFRGIEIDVFYQPNQNTFAVKHDLEDQGSDLDLFLDSVLVYKQTPIWIDYKNMNIEPEKGINKLTEILSQHNLLEHCFVESYNLGALKMVKGRFFTSFWTGSNGVPESRSAQDSLYNANYKQIDLSRFTMLSASHEMFEFFSYYFPDVKCNYWLSGSLNAQAIERVNTIATAPNTNVILIDGNLNYIK